MRLVPWASERGPRPGGMSQEQNTLLKTMAHQGAARAAEFAEFRVEFRKRPLVCSDTCIFTLNLPNPYLEKSLPKSAGCPFTKCWFCKQAEFTISLVYGLYLTYVLQFLFQLLWFHRTATERVRAFCFSTKQPPAAPAHWLDHFNLNEAKHTTLLTGSPGFTKMTIPG